MMKMGLSPARIVLHSAAVASMTYGYLNLHNLVVDSLVKNQFGGHWQFLTIDGLVLAWLTMAVSLANDLVPGVKPLQSLKRAIFILSAPLSVVTTVVYWTLILLLPHMILQLGDSGPSSSYQAPPDWRIPLKLDLALHVVPGTALILDFFLFEAKYSHEATKWFPLMSLLLAGIYVPWVELCGAKNGVFPYPFLTQNPFPIRLAIYGGATTVGGFSFLAMNALHP